MNVGLPLATTRKVDPDAGRDGNRLDFVSECKVNMVFSGKRLILAKWGRRWTFGGSRKGRRGGGNAWGEFAADTIVFLFFLWVDRFFLLTLQQRPKE